MNIGIRNAARGAAMLVAAVLLPYFVPGAMRPAPEYLKSAVVYQIVLRNFTRDGNFKAAAEMLEHVRSAGVDIVYLTPFVEMDCDMDESGWSPRQIKSGYHTPKNPYRISNYDKIDPEYGKDGDFKSFNDKAHALGMKVYMDLVYLHCGPNNVLKGMFPDAFQKNADGTVRMTRWHFPYVNFESKDVRRYLIDSMLHWMRLGCDGFRCDVGDEVPIDFWVEAVSECQKTNPDLVMINEGVNAEWLEKAFDACYAWPWSRAIRRTLTPRLPAAKSDKCKTLAARMARMREYEAKIPEGALMLCYMDNHDTAADDWECRFDRVNPVEGGNAAFVLTFLRRGLPLLFNGNEIADNALNTFFAPVEDVARARKTVDWGRALQSAGQKRLALIRSLARLRHEDDVFSEGSQEWVVSGEDVGAIAFVRRNGGRAVFVAANLTGREVSFAAEGWLSVGKPILAEGGKLTPDGICCLGPYGYVVVCAKQGDELPLADISGETNRHVVIAAGTEAVYQGHPTTVLSDDCKRMFCVWTLNHGGKCGPAAESLDGGRTWKRVDGRLPAVYAATHMNCPTLQKLKTPEDRERWLIFSRKGEWDKSSGSPGRLGVMASDDCGLTWRESGVFDLPAAMPPTGFIQLKDGSCALFGQERKNPKAQNDGAANDQVIWMSVSHDGGITWGERRTVAAADQKNLCEPFALRSPDGKEICLLMRENRRSGLSMMCFSRDEGMTWTEPVDTCRGLTGDRHEGVMLHDGRWVIAHRDMLKGSPTYGHYVAWVGTYDDIRNARPGQHRIKLFHSYAGDKNIPNHTWNGDCGYSGVELLPNGEIVCTTYVKYWPDTRRHSVILTRFRIEETDAMIADSVNYSNLPQPSAP